MTVLFIVGPPGVGKTSLARKIIRPDRCYLVDKPKWTVRDDLAAAGHYTGGTFDGADTVAYNGVEAALNYWKVALRRKPLTLFDGDRFSHEGVVNFFKASKVPVLVVLLTATEAQLAERRKARKSNQNAAWMKGRATKAERFAAANKGISVPSDEKVFDAVTQLMAKTLSGHKVRP